MKGGGQLRKVPSIGRPLPSMKLSRAFALLALGTVLPAAPGSSATLDAFFDFTRYGSVSPGSSITSNVHGNIPALVKPTGTTLNQWGVAIDTEKSAGDTGVLIPASALAGYTGDFTLQIWFITSVGVAADTMICGGTTSLSIDDSLQGDQALFLGYNNTNKLAKFLRPVVGNGGRWGAAMDVPAGTGMALLSTQDYVITYNSASRAMIAYLNGRYVGTVNVSGFGGLSALANGFVIGGVQNSAFKNDGSAAVNIRSFLIYSGALTPSQVSRIHSGGPSVTLDALREADVVVK
jgi:hypothetical protein